MSGKQHDQTRRQAPDSLGHGAATPVCRSRWRCAIRLFTYAGVAFWCALAASVATGSGAVAAASTTSTQSFSVAGKFGVTVPANATQVQIDAVGGAGAAGQSATGSGGAAGSGTDVSETLPVAPGTQIVPGGNLTVVVGSRGGGGLGGSGDRLGGKGGNGGGATQLLTPSGYALVVAGGGGGGGGGAGFFGSDGGAGGTYDNGTATYVAGSIAARGGAGGGQCAPGVLALTQGGIGESDTSDDGGDGGGGGEGFCGGQSGGSGDHGAGNYVDGAGGGGGGAGASEWVTGATSLSVAGASNIGDGSLTVTFTLVSPATGTLSASTISFADRQVGTTSQTQYVTLTNNGDLPLTFDGLFTTGLDPNDFVGSLGTCGATIAPHSSCELGASFSPTAAGDRSAILLVSDSGPDSPQEIILTGHALAPATATLNPSTISFGNQQVGTTSAPKQVTLTNNGDVPLTFNGVSLSSLDSGNFIADSGTCGSSIGAHSSCAIAVKFTPQGASAHGATLIVTDSAPNSPQRIALSGTGVFPDAVLEQSDIAFGAQRVGTTSQTQYITLENKGGVPVTLTGVAATGQDALDFTASRGTCGASVPAYGSCQIGASFSPTAPGDRSAAVLVSDNAANSPQQITVGGTGTETTTVTLSAPQSPTAGSQIVLSATVKPIPDGGTVAFVDNGYPITGCQSQPVNTTTGTASCSLSYASAGNHTVTAGFGGDAAFGGSTATAAFAVSGPSTQSVSPQGTTQATTTTPLAATGAPTTSAKKAAPKSTCVVPRLGHKTLSQARRALSHAHCRVGAVHMPAHLPAHRVAHVGRQSTAAATRKQAGFRVSLWLIG